MATELSLIDGGKIEFKHSPNRPGFLIFADSQNFEPADLADSQFNEYEYIAKQMKKESIIAWGTPEANLRISIIDALKCNPPKKFSAATDFPFRTHGRVIFGDDMHIYSDFFDGKIPDFDPSREKQIQVNPGRYLVTVYRHFPWREGEQDAKRILGIDFTISLFPYRLPYNVTQLAIPWTGPVCLDL